MDWNFSYLVLTTALPRQYRIEKLSGIEIENEQNYLT